MKYQNFDRALTSSSAHNFMRNTSGSGCASVGTCRPTTWYWWYCVEQSFARFLVSRSFVERFDRAHREHEIIFPQTRRRARDARRESVERSDRGETLRATTGRWDDARATHPNFRHRSRRVE